MKRLLKWVGIVVGASFLLSIVVGNLAPSEDDTSTSPRVTVVATPTPTPTPTATPVIPAEGSYSVIGTGIVPGVKRSLDVRLSEKVSEDVLRAIAIELKASDSREYDRTFILYYLPDMTVDAGAWATTHFNPTLEVRILGLTDAEEQALVAKVVALDRDVIGSWLDEITYAGSRITIYREDSTLYMEWEFKDGSGLKEELIEMLTPLGQRFDWKDGSSFGDHWIIDRDGNLQIRDNAGLVSTAKRIQ
ncbi:MAG: hypothetical protein IIC95_05530 [Chloroflexi bacterium]|nr:hypothetical protein [Chloroflexota bacterium]MCH7655434.1 hypothetical protein [Chloroflexota bacterium]